MRMTSSLMDELLPSGCSICNKQLCSCLTSSTYQAHLSLLGYPEGNCPLWSGEGEVGKRERVTNIQSFGGLQICAQGKGKWCQQCIKWTREKLFRQLLCDAFQNRKHIFETVFCIKILQRLIVLVLDLQIKTFLLGLLFFFQIPLCVLSREDLTEEFCSLM